ncbi:MAG TPA: LysR family transcriptional regulator [Pseudonocardiaceae bacterium]|jgi:DNA-binding transcriptional LysR family regulator|nr:LysR family transcriptional regulator [Pseudonocardiaceae bacterium]
MELRHLEYFVAVADERHFTRAANRLLVSQSGLSASIRALERELGAPLFVRNTRRVELTELGRATLLDARQALASVVAVKQAAAAVSGLLRGTLAIGTEQCIGVVDVAAVLARFHAAHPGVEIQLSQAGSARLANDVGAGRLDMAFVATAGDPPDGVRLVPMADEPMVLLCHPAHPLAGTVVDWADLAEETFVDFHPDWGARQVTDRAFGEAGVSRRVTLEVNDVHSLLDLVDHGLGMAMVPRPVADKPQATTLCVLRVPGDHAPIWHVAAAVPEHTQPSAAGLAFLSEVPGFALVPG